jgi:hypothetical protein
MGLLTMPDLIAQDHHAGLTLTPVAGKLRVTGPRRNAHPDLIAALRKHKLGVLGQLAADSIRITTPTITTADGAVFHVKCPCARHPHLGHEATPITRLENLT